MEIHYLVVALVFLFSRDSIVDAEKDKERPKKPSDLKMAIVIHRHGDRAALHTYPTDPYGEAIWPEGFGHLTPRGVKTLYKQGKFLRKRYEDFLDRDQTAKEVRYEASAYTRTLKSGTALAAGLFPPTSRQKWDDDDLGEKWTPTPIFSREADHDTIFGVADCPEFDRLKANLDDLPETAGLKSQHSAFAQYLKNSTRMAKFNFPASCTTLHDILYAQTQHGYPLPDWATDKVFQLLTTLGDQAFRMHCGAGNTPESHKRIRLRAGNLLRTFIEKMEAKVNATGSENTTTPKLLMYSGHDTNIGLLLASLGQYNDKMPESVARIPGYGSLLILELFQNNTVRISLKNDRADRDSEKEPPTVLTHPSCTTYCPLQKLKELVKTYFMEEEEFYTACKSAADGGSDKATTKAAKPKAA